MRSGGAGPKTMFTHAGKPIATSAEAEVKNPIKP
jgi:hypothetical protein